jgi:endo-1,4-beta-D-glucanase Y
MCRQPQNPPQALLLARALALSLLLLLGPGCAESPSLSRLEAVLQASWQGYCRDYLTPEGRVALPERAGGTISEAQAYALLRAVWAGDEATFARVYGWTVTHLSRVSVQGDHLLAWHWGRREDGSWGVLDWHTASDANLDFALALTLAARRGWRPPPSLPGYLEEARQVAAAILEKETVLLPNGELLLTPGEWREDQPPYLVNPSYFSPAAYRLLAQGPQEPRWERLHAGTYQLLSRLGQGLGDRPGVGLFPDWCQVDAKGTPSPAPGRDSHFGWEAVRLPFRLALDRLWFGEERATPLLARRFLPFFKKEWQARGRLAAVYSWEGEPLVNFESPVLYAGVLAAALAAGEKDFARELAAKILSFYQERNGRGYFVAPDNYYANNWAWLGLALYAGRVKP